MILMKYAGIFKTDEENNQVNIYRVLHGKRSVDTILKELEAKG